MRHSPLLLKYLQIYEKNPHSYAFAPLAQAYRKLGAIQEALKVLKQGLALHPHYLLGHIVLASCYFDMGQFAYAQETLKYFIHDHSDNILLQTLYASIHEKLDEKEEALAIYKHLLFLNPKREEWQKKVALLEHEVVDGHPEKIILPEERPAKASQNSKGEGWETLPCVSLPPAPEESEGDKKREVSFTLVDLYSKQGHYDKALKVLDKILELNPRHQEAFSRKEALILQKNTQNVELFLTSLEKRYNQFLNHLKRKRDLSLKFIDDGYFSGHNSVV